MGDSRWLVRLVTDRHTIRYHKSEVNESLHSFPPHFRRPRHTSSNAPPTTSATQTAAAVALVEVAAAP
eukprot:3410278-Prymnesium_polylepis.1